MSFVISPGVIQTPLTAGGVAYGTGTVAKVTSAGTSGQVLTSQGVSAPVWAAVTAGLNLLSTLTPANGTTSASATSLTASKAIIFMIDLLTLSAPGGNISIALSSDNGATYGAAVTITNSATNPQGFGLFFNTATAGVSKPDIYWRGGLAQVIGTYSSTTGIINAVQFTVNGTTFAGTGNIYIYGMN